MRCPFCGGEMEKGALDAGSATLKYINSEHPRLHPFFCDPMNGEIELGLHAGKSRLLGSFRIPAYKCGACQKIMIDYSGEAEKDPAFSEWIKELKN